MRTTRFSIAFASAVAALCLGPARGEDPPPPDKTPTVVVPVGDAPVVDGTPGEETWKGAASIELRRGDDVHGVARLLRARRELYVAYDCPHTPFAIGLRLRFSDPATGRGVVVLATPLHPPLSPMSGFLERPGNPADRLDMSICDLRTVFRGDQGFSSEMRLPLDMLEVGRSDKVYGFTAEILDLMAQKVVAVYPTVAEGPVGGQGVAKIRPATDWGADIPLERPATQPALEVLHQLELESVWQSGGKPSGEEVKMLLAFTGNRDGKRKEAPLIALEKRLRELIAAYPDYLSLRANLVRVLTNLNRPGEAFETLDRIREEFPDVLQNERQVLVRMQLLRDQGRYLDAAAALDEGMKEIGPIDGAGREHLVLETLAANWKIEQDIRAREAKRDDLPRVLFKTNKGEIVLELFEDDAPNAVANFITLCESKFYDGTRFHWVTAGRFAFGGDANSRNDDEADDGFGDPGYVIEPEPGRRLNFPMTIAFAEKRRTRRSEGSAFVLNIGPVPERDAMCTVFGRVVSGEDTVRHLDFYDTLETATVVRKRAHPYEVVKRP